MAVKKREFGYHNKDNGDEWWFYLCVDTVDTAKEPFIVIETEFRGKRNERRMTLRDYLASGERGRTKLIELMRSWVLDPEEST
ncbi:hypothetical protein [Pseudidiomarina sp.]|uniref:hypothetical protein n=1 Tax=Pseudidiomarina sp. TaxID=2081707 RepID=UPI003A987790